MKWIDVEAATRKAMEMAVGKRLPTLIIYNRAADTLACTRRQNPRLGESEYCAARVFPGENFPTAYGEVQDGVSSLLDWLSAQEEERRLLDFIS